MDVQVLLSLLREGKKYGMIKCKDIDLNNTEMHICTFLSENEKSSQDEIAKAYSMDKTTVAKALSKLEKKKLIKREVNVKNRRENIISLTDEGERIVKEIVDVNNEWLRQVTSTISEEEMMVFDSVADRMLIRAKELI